MKKYFTIITFMMMLWAAGPKEVHAQTDTEFWFAVPKVTQGHDWDRRRFYFRFANLNLENTITISMPANPGFAPIVRNLAPNQALTVEVTDIIQQLWNENPNQIYNRGIRISATNLTTAYFEVGTHNNPDIYSLKGRNALGTDFYVPFQDHFANGNYNPKAYSGIYIVATQDDTKITITPSKNVFPGRIAGVPFDTILHMGQSIAIVPHDYLNTGQQANRRLGGTRVQSNKPIAISTSDDSVAANPYGGCRDLIGDQLIPTSIIGTEYIAMRGRLGIGGSPTMPEFFYVLGTKPDTKVFIDGALEAIIQPGQQIRWQFTKQNHHILTSEPAYVYHVAGFGCEMGGAVLPPINVCTGSTKVSFTRSKGESFFLNIMVRAGAEDGFIFRGNGPNTIIKASDFVTVPGSTDWLAAEYQMNETQVPVGVASLIENTKDVFHLGIINGGPSSGTMYGYFSDFNKLDIRANISGTGAMHKACFGDPVQLIAQGGVNYQWSPPDFLDDPTSATPIALPDTSIKYTVTVSGACKMKDSTSVYVSLYGPANAAFTVDEAVGCSPFRVDVVNQSFGISHYSWRMGDGTTYTTGAKSFHHTYTNPTDEPITRTLMLVGRYSMCRDTMQTKITIYPDIKARLAADIVAGCSPLQVKFSNLSTGAQNYHWDFGDGSISNRRDTLHTFYNYSSKDTTFTVRLTAISKYGCISEDSVKITVKPYLETGFTFDPPVQCSPYPVTFNNTSFGTTQNLWSFDGGISFQNIPARVFERTFVNNTESPKNFEIWLIGANGSGCRDTLIRTVTVNPFIEAKFTTDVTEGCNPLPVSFLNFSTPGSTFTWEFDGHEGHSSEENPLVWFDNPSPQDTAYFNVKLTATSPWMCTHITQKQIKVYPRIEAAFSFDDSVHCTPVEMAFQNTSTGASLYFWSFGDNSTSNSGDETVFHLFQNTTLDSIIYPVRLIVENDAGCRDTITRPVIIYPQVIADFDLTSEGCHPLLVNFNNKTTGASRFSWSFGDGGNSLSRDPAARVYTNESHFVEKQFEVHLLAESRFGCQSSISRSINVLPKPHAAYTMSDASGCAPIDINFANGSQGATKLFWTFGDGSGTFENNGNIKHTYQNDGLDAISFSSRLIAENQFGCRDTVTKGANIFPSIKAEIGISAINGCHPMEVEIVNKSRGATAQTPYIWKYGDGNTSTLAGSTHKYTYNNFSHLKMEHFTLELFAESKYGCKDYTQTNVLVFPKPKAIFEPLVTEGCSPLDVGFTEASMGAKDFTWYFGDGQTATKPGSVTHMYSRSFEAGPEEFPIALMVKNQFGCTDSTHRTVKVYPEVKADFVSITEGCHPLEVDFTNLSLGQNSLTWSFGDGSTSSRQNPTYTFVNDSYTQKATYNVNLKVASVYGCKSEITTPIVVFPKPKSEFSLSVEEGCSPLPVKFHNKSIGGDVYNWNIGGGHSNESNPVFEKVFANQDEKPQTYSIKLNTVNSYGCSRDSEQQVTVFPEVTANFVADNIYMKGCSPLDLEFINLSLRADKFAWDFDDGNSSTLSGPKNVFFTGPEKESSYNIRLKAISDYGCKDSIVRRATVFPVPVADMYVSPRAQVFPSKSIRLENHSAPGNWKFEWDMGDGTILKTDKFDTIEYEFSWPSGDYATRQFRVSLSVSNDYCMDSISQKVSVNAPFPIVGFEPSAQGCPPLSIQFRNDSEYGLEFFWDFDDGNYSNLENPYYTFYEPGEYIVKLLVSGEGGIDSAYQTITVFELPTADFRVTPENVQLPYESVKMINLSSLAAYYEWHMGDGTIYYEPEPEHKYDNPGNYDIRLNVATNTFPQCFGQIVKTNAVKAEQLCDIIFPDAFTPNTSGPNGGVYITNDPANHVFYPIHTGVSDYKLEIFNRWGEFLFRSEDIDIGWDGYYRGKLSQMGVYVWRVSATCHNGKKIEKTGDVTLYR